MLRYHLQTIEAPSGGSSAFVFNSVPQEYDDLLLVVSARTSQAIDSWSDIGLRFNGDSANYTSRVLYGAGSGNSAGLGETSIFMRVSTANNAPNTFASYRAYIPNYRSNSTKSVSIEGANETNATLAIQKISSSLWNSTAAITTVSLVPQSGVLVQFSSASLYGIKRFAGSVVAATGGVVTTSGGYTIHTFESSGTFVPSKNMQVDYLVVAGGGAAGYRGAGGGAGGYRTSAGPSGGGAAAEASLAVTSGTSYAITVGAGGAGSTSTKGSNGSNSVFHTITSTGGGAGGEGQNNDSSLGNGNSGGSGGGGATWGGNTWGGGSGTSGQGFAGGSGWTDGATGRAAGGGGGAGQAGAAGTSTAAGTGGNGGNGVSSAISGVAVTRAGGGGGSGDGARGVGGSGGGGASLVGQAGQSGTSNTGSGGGASNGSNFISGSGGSGVVIIRYLTPA